MNTASFSFCVAAYLVCSVLGEASSLPPWLFEVVVPKNLSTTIEGAGRTEIPFGTFPIPNFQECNSCRFQQVIAADEFSETPQQNGYIYSILTRGDTCNPGSQTTTMEGVVIRLSTTSRSPDNLSLRFSENIGSDERVVFEGAVSAYGGGDCGNVPAGFEANWYLLSRSFPYSPRKGNLLIDMEYAKKTFSPGARGATMDAQIEMGDGISMIYGCPNTAEVAKEALTAGLVFQFFIIRPQLTVTDQGDSILLKWARRLPNFRLQATELIGQELVWKNYGTVDWPNDGETNYATLKKSELGKTRYFRLYSDSPTSP